MKYVVVGTTIKHGVGAEATVYQEGEQIDLKPEEAKLLKGRLMPVEQWQAIKKGASEELGEPAEGSGEPGKQSKDAKDAKDVKDAKDKK